MNENHLWLKSKTFQIQTGPDIVGGFSIGFDSIVPEETREKLMDFTYWVEDHFDLPITLWVDFKYKRYLIDEDKKRVGYKFYSVPFTTYPVFDNWDDLPVIELAVNRSVEELLPVFVEAVSCYFAWLTNEKATGNETQEILNTYLQNTK